MNPDQPKKLITLNEAAVKLSVSVETLLQWNEHNILKPTFTISGEIGYAEEQIEKFLIIRKRISAERQESFVPASGPGIWDKSTDPAEKTHESASGQHKGVQSIRFLSSVGVVSAFLIIAVFTQSDKLKAIFDLYKQQYGSGAFQAQTSTLSLSAKQAVDSPIELGKEAADSKSLQAASESILQEQNNPINNLYTTLRNAAVTIAQNHALISVPKGSQAKISKKLDTKADMIAATVAGYTTFASRTLDAGLEDHVFDENGNIKGEAKDNLAMVLGGVNALTGAETSGTAGSNPLAQIIFLAAGLFAFVLIFPKRISYAPKVTNVSSVPAQDNTAIGKIIEVGQKTDGTIVVSVEGKEYKISKPELYSESDQFFERLMENANPGIKEMEYDAFKDEKIKYSTPLSRLATRLGFVGIKRDLFFPRTSKDRVLFRRFLTRQDLADMNLTTEQILQELTPVS